ncbi:2-oxoglutarate dehydrogenase complex dihydrolipoyllysine-residue succinyltransferase [Alkalibacillus haloalkaliphilus]|uniref:2-oxoglutarate dehydrogenase complex dihydrolipoyllysine-residue succinyltransferase n=1 Tax=Alkalibacillus haloalkaliphilus TaxID=94136 RepID=UPI0029358DB0|nr:2-oxoglutarate dehydrogenase complex dihydrolipoyllysine-residue succinyltransferase [Alkalibacillus haloalkaliphilus]MDV2582468.1 2-oxoglutarate dehydrogenase complex dihydrolipoyllysine-residue succinyltransferase [Alkalibacillus haloalkaliphilus]
MKEIIVPELAESITEGTVAEWLVSEGDQVGKGDPIVELETDKVNVEVNSDYAGVITELLVGEGEDVEVGDAIAKVDESGEGAASSDSGSDKEEKSEEPAKDEKKEDKKEEKESDEKQPTTKEETADHDPDQPVASPATRKRARELGIDLSEIKPKDPVGRISKEDVEAAAKSKADEGKKKDSKKESKKDQSAEKTEFDKPVEREKMSRRRQTIAKRLVEAQEQSAMLTTFNEVDMTNIMNVRSDRKDDFEKKHGIKLGFMSFFTKAVIGALKEFPLLNAEIQGDEIVKKQFYDIGMAVSTEEGLVVPVVRDADRLSFAGIEGEIMDVAKKARDGQLSMKDLQGGSFTITNGGIFGSLLSTPILNTPQVGILGMHKIEKRPKVMPDDSIEVRPMMYLALSYDHRIVDGREAVQFLNRVKEMVEDPYDLLLEG